MLLWFRTLFKCSIGKAGMLWPLRTQGTDTEERGVRGGRGGGMLLPKQRENRRGKNVAVYSLIVWCIWGLVVWTKKCSIWSVDEMLQNVLKIKIGHFLLSYDLFLEVWFHEVTEVKSLFLVEKFKILKRFRKLFPCSFYFLWDSFVLTKPSCPKCHAIGCILADFQ